MNYNRGAVYSDGFWYYFSDDGELLTSNDYSNVYEYSLSLAAVERDGKWGYIDISGKEIIELQFEATRPVINSRAWIKQDGKWGIADLSDFIPSDIKHYKELSHSKTLIQPDIIVDEIEFLSTTTELYLRRGPDITYETLLVIPKDSDIGVHGAFESNNEWIFISYCGIKGWVKTTTV